jgi:hypothetical protein
MPERKIPGTDRADSIPLTENRVNTGNIARFVRVPTPDYLQRVLRSTPEQADTISKIGIYLMPTQAATNTDYLESAQQATRYLESELERNVQDDISFRELINNYSFMSSYTTSFGETPATIRKFPVIRQLIVPVPIASPLYTLIPALGGETYSPPQWIFPHNFSPVYNPHSELYDSFIAPYNQSEREVPACLTEIRGYTQAAFKNKDLDAAIDALYSAETSWLWGSGNQSRSVNYFNVILDKIGFEPISHGVIDFAAGCLKREDFKKYVKFVIAEESKSSPKE